MSEINQKEYKICIANCEYIAPCRIKFVQIDCKNKKDGVCDDTCFIKQLQRLKQQIEAYQLSENEAKEIIAELKHKNKRLQEENEELKERLKNQCI